MREFRGINIKDQSQTHKVGIVVPIYNVEQYLRECLDSILAQSYQNFEVVLVNDGSTDTSLNIAKEYVLKDKRFVLIDKENGGLSNARNTGIYWFQSRFLQAKKLAGGGDDILQTYQCQNIHIITHKDRIPTPSQIDWICFLDSDDIWRDTFLEKCLVNSSGADIVWCDYECYYDNVAQPSEVNLTLQESYSYADSMLVSSSQWLEDSAERGFFYWAWSGIIDFVFLCKKQVYFLDFALHEDHNFGTLLFIQASNIFVLKDKLYLYRIRPNSICNFTQNKNLTYPAYVAKVYQAFSNQSVAREYYRSTSLFLQLEELHRFKQKQTPQVQPHITKLIQGTYCHFSLKLFESPKDPLKLIYRLSLLNEYVRLKPARKLILAYPQYFELSYPLRAFGFYLKSIERYIRHKIKKKKS